MNLAWSQRRICRRTDFQRAYKTGKRWNGRNVNVFSVGNEEQFVRFGITITRKSGGAVVRNRLRRQIREILRSFSFDLPPVSRDLIIHVRPGVQKHEFGILRDELEKLIDRALAHQPSRNPFPVQS